VKKARQTRKQPPPTLPDVSKKRMWKQIVGLDGPADTRDNHLFTNNLHGSLTFLNRR
jgi:hypothetical protein